MILSPSEMQDFDVRGVIQVGANQGQEIVTFFDVFGAEKVIAFEPLEEMLARIPDRENLIKSSMALGSSTGIYGFYVANNDGQSSSFLTPKEHLQEHPWVGFTSERRILMTTLDQWFEDSGCKKEDYNFLSIDVQGFELQVLIGARKTLAYIDYIMCEVNCKELYEGCAMIEQIDEYLFDFTRVKTEWCDNHGWGDALYVRKK
jgi:FkbM family methyltransferase